MGEEKKRERKEKAGEEKGDRERETEGKMGEEERCFQNLPRGPRGTQGFS